MSRLSRRLKKSIDELDGKLTKLSLWERFVVWLQIPETYDGATPLTTTSGSRITFSIAEWIDWDALMKKKYPLRYFLTEIVPAWYKERVRKTKNAVWWVRYRTISRHHVLKVRSLQPGWTDRDERMLHAAFQILVDYVEVELARTEYTTLTGGKRSREKGLAHLEWEINEPSCKMGASPTQSESAKEKKALYLWWVDSRLKRTDVWEEPSIWDGYDIEDHDSSDQRSDQASYLESLHLAEDQRMLERLIAIRSTLWS